MSSSVYNPLSDPVSKAKSVVFTDEGLDRAEAAYRRLFDADTACSAGIRKRCHFVLTAGIRIADPPPDRRAGAFA